MDYKTVYTNKFLLSLNNQGFGFIANNLNYFVFQMPILMLIHFLFAMLFKLTSKYKVSILFRKYSFKALFLLLLFEGNIEQFTFYFIAEAQIFFSKNIFHKLINFSIVLFFFLTTFFAFGVLLWLRYHYRRKIKYIIADYKVRIPSIFF